MNLILHFSSCEYLSSTTSTTDGTRDGTTCERASQAARLAAGAAGGTTGHTRAAICDADPFTRHPRRAHALGAALAEPVTSTAARSSMVSDMPEAAAATSDSASAAAAFFAAAVGLPKDAKPPAWPQAFSTMYCAPQALATAALFLAAHERQSALSGLPRPHAGILLAGKHFSPTSACAHASHGAWAAPAARPVGRACRP